MKRNWQAEWRTHAWGLGWCTLLTVAVFVGGWQPLFARRAQRLAAAAALEQGRQQLAEAAAVVQSAKKQLAAAQKQWEGMRVRLAPLGQLNQRLADLAELASGEGLEVAGVQPGSPRAVERYQVVPLPLTGRGSYRSFTDFLRRLHRECPDMGVTSVSLRAADAGSASFAVNLVWYATSEGTPKR